MNEIRFEEIENGGRMEGGLAKRVLGVDRRVERGIGVSAKVGRAFEAAEEGRGAQEGLLELPKLAVAATAPERAS